jgi:hypothetical protein
MTPFLIARLWRQHARHDQEASKPALDGGCQCSLTLRRRSTRYGVIDETQGHQTKIVAKHNLNTGENRDGLWLWLLKVSKHPTECSPAQGHSDFRHSSRTYHLDMLQAQSH